MIELGRTRAIEALDRDLPVDAAVRPGCDPSI